MYFGKVGSLAREARAKVAGNSPEERKLLLVFGGMLLSGAVLLGTAIWGKPAIGGLLIVLWVWLSPFIIAYLRGHPEKRYIFFLLVLLGWSILGWALALLWACSRIKREGEAPDEPPPQPRGELSCQEGT